MKSLVTVLIDSSVKEIEPAFNKSLDAHYESRFDYRYYLDGHELDNQALRDKYPEESEVILDNACYVKDLYEEFATPVLVCLDGSWIELEDFGWAMADNPCESNTKAEKEYLVKMNKILEENREQICVFAMVHS